MLLESILVQGGQILSCAFGSHYSTGDILNDAYFLGQESEENQPPDILFIARKAEQVVLTYFPITNQKWGPQQKNFFENKIRFFTFF